MIASFRRFLPLLRAEWRTLLVGFAAMAVLALSSTGYVALTGPLLKTLFVKGPLVIDLGVLGAHELALSGLNDALVLPLLIVALALVKGTAQAVQFTLAGRVALRSVARLRLQAFERLLISSPRFYVERNTADLVGRLTTDTERVELAVFNGLMPLVRDTLSVLFLFATCVVLDPKLSLFAIVTVPLSALPLARFSKWLKKVSRASQDELSALGFSAFESVSGIRTVQAFGSEEFEKRRFSSSAERHMLAMFRSYLIRGVRTPVMEVLGAIGLAGLLYGLGRAVSEQSFDATHVAAFAAAVVFMYDPVKKLGNVGDVLATGAAALDRIYELIDAPVDIPPSKGSPPVAEVRGGVRFDEVVFRYRDATVLDGVSLDIAPGKVCALVGRSGAGKSTLVSLLLRFYAPERGDIRVDGVSIKDWPLDALRAQLAWVSQDVFLFNASVRDNVCAGAQHSDAEVLAALSAANATDFVRQLPEQLDTVLGERGTTLSGGQKQRIAIARAFLRDAPILLLDEATSALDSESERAVQHALDKLMQGRTTIVIAHRFSTIRNADAIVVLDAGRVVEQGRHDELITRDGPYRALARLQFERADVA